MAVTGLEWRLMLYMWPQMTFYKRFRLRTYISDIGSCSVFILVEHHTQQDDAQVCSTEVFWSLHPPKTVNLWWSHRLWLYHVTILCPFNALFDFCRQHNTSIIVKVSQKKGLNFEWNVFFPEWWDKRHAMYKSSFKHSFKFWKQIPKTGVVGTEDIDNIMSQHYVTQDL